MARASTVFWINFVYGRNVRFVPCFGHIFAMFRKDPVGVIPVRPKARALVLPSSVGDRKGNRPPLAASHTPGVFFKLENTGNCLGETF